jgi:transcriptional regulator with XRE-family HTH domain
LDLKKYRNLRNLTCEQLASKMATTKATISRWESGTRTPAPEQIKQLAIILGCSTDQLLGFPGINPTPPSTRAPKGPRAKRKAVNVTEAASV